MAASGSLELLVTLNCTSDESSETKKLTISPVPKLVAAVKTSIETAFEIPRCLQRVSLDDHVLTDSQDIGDLYIRNKDHLSVTYLAKANVTSIREFTRLFLHPLTVLLGTDPKLLNRTDKEIEDLMDYSENGLCNMAFSDLLPWRSPVAEANRQFFIQEDGVRHTVQLLSLLNQPPWDFSRWRHMLLRLEISCLSLLWNFSETAYARRMVVDGGGWEVMVRSLLHYPKDQFLAKYRIHDIFDTAVGCISNYSELESCQLPLVQNKPAMDLLLTFAVHGPSLNIFTKMLIANCLFRLTHSHETHRYLANVDVLGPVLEFYDLYQGNPTYGPNIAMRYMMCLALARILLFSYDAVPSQCRPQMLKCMDQFLTVAKAPQIASLEEKYQYNWITVFPFLETLYAPLMDCVKSKSYSIDSDDPVKEKCQYWSTCVAVLSMEAEMSRECNRELLLRQKLLDYVVCLPWEMPGHWKLRCGSVVSHFAKEGRVPIPKLSSIAKAKLARSGLRRLKELIN